MNKIFFVSLILMGFGSGSILAKEQPVALKIATADLNAAYPKLNEVAPLAAQLKKEEEKIIESENKARAEIEAEMAKMEKMDEKAKLAAQKTLGAKINTIQQKLNQERTALEQKNQSMQADVQKKLLFALEEVRKAGGYDLIINAAAVLAASDAMKAHDKTTELVEKYNTMFKVKPEASKPGAKPAAKPAVPAKK